MVEAFFFGSLVWIMVVGGKVLIQALATMPIIGGLAGLYLNMIGPLPDGMISNLIYGAMVAHLIILPLGVLMFAPRWIHQLYAGLQARQKA